MTIEKFTREIIDLIYFYQYSSLSENDFAELACNLLKDFEKSKEGDGFA